MKIFVPSEGPRVSSLLAWRPVKARWFVVFDTARQQLDVLDYPSERVSKPDQGRDVADWVIERGDVVLTQHCGSESFDQLKTHRVEIILNQQGMVRDAISRYLSRQVEVAKEPDLDVQPS